MRLLLISLERQCNGTPAESLFFSSLAPRYRQISGLKLLSRPPGVLLWPDGLQSIVIRSSSSTTTSPSSILPSGAFFFLPIAGREQGSIKFITAAVTGLAVCGHQREHPVKNRAAPLEPVMPHAKISFRTTEVPSRKPVRIYKCPGSFCL